MINFIKNLFTKKNSSESRSPHSDFWYNAIAALSFAGVPVTPENALKVSAIWACNQVLSQDIAQLPLLTYERLSNKGKERAEDHYLYDVLKDKPNKIQTSYEWRMTMQLHKGLYGRAYSKIKRDQFGEIKEYGLPIHPTRVKNVLLENETLRFIVSTNGTDQPYDDTEILYLRGMTINGYDGISPIEAGSNTIGLAIATELFGSRFFQKGARPNMSLTHPETLSTDAQSNLAASVKRMSEDGVLILEEGMEQKMISTSPEESQFLQTRQHQVEEVARWYRMPLHKIEHLLRATFSNIEQQSQEYVVDTLMPHIKNWEQRLNETMLEEDNKFFVEFLVQGLLRGDIKTRAIWYRSLFQMASISPNEIRLLENLNPTEGGDNYYMQTSMAKVNDDGSLGAEESNDSDNDVVENLARNAAGRIANAETRELDKLGDKDKDSFYDKHYGYMQKTLEPFGVELDAPENLTTQNVKRSQLESSIFDYIMQRQNNG